MSIVVNGENGISVQLGEIAVVHWNDDHTVCSFWLKGNATVFSIRPLVGDRVRTGELDESEPTAARLVVVFRSSLEIMRKRFPA